MDKIVKLLKKAKEKDRERLLACIEVLESGELETLKVKKLGGSPFYRVRVGDFRIVFSIDKQKRVLIESVRLRNEKTYQ